MSQYREIMIPGDILDNQNITDGAKILYGKIARLSYKEGYCWASNSFLDGTKSGRNASRFIAELKTARYLKIEGGRGKKRRIILCSVKSEVDNLAKIGVNNEPNPANSGELTSPKRADNLAKIGDRTTNITSKRTTKSLHVGSDEPTPSQKSAVELATLLLTTHRKVMPDYLSGKDDQKTIENWAKDIEKLIRIDQKKPEIIRQVILWAKTPDNFWFPNIQSGYKLREKYEQLFCKMQMGKSGTSLPVSSYQRQKKSLEEEK
jgi:hypothetical protein